MKYIWRLINKKDNSLYQLQKDPREWEQLSIKRYRSETYHGIFIEPSTRKFSFTKNGGGYEYILQAFTQDDVNAHVELEILAYGNAINTYRPRFKGKLNFGNLVVNRDTVEVMLEDSDLVSKLKSREEISVDLSSTSSIGGSAITAAATRTITLPPQNIYMLNRHQRNGTQPFTIADNNLSQVVQFPLGTPYYYDYYHFPLMNEDRTDLGGTMEVAELFDFQLEENYAGPSDQLFDYSNAKFSTIGINGKVNLFYSVRVKCNYYEYDGPATGTDSGIDCTQFKLILAFGPDWESRGSIVLHDAGTFTRDTATNHTASFDLTVTGDIFLNPGDKVWVYWFQRRLAWAENSSNLAPGPASISSNIEWTYGVFPTTGRAAKVELWLNYQHPETTTKAVMIHEAFNQVVDSIADVNASFRSSFYGRTDSAKVTYPANGNGAFLSITDGKLLRGYDKPIALSFRKLFTSASAVHNIGMKIVNNLLYIERMQDFYTNTRIGRLQNVRSLKTSVSPVHYFNQIMVGYARWSSEVRNGLDEPCTRHEYSTQVNSIKNATELISEILASSYAIELQRIKNKESWGNEDLELDEEHFWLALNTDYTIETDSQFYDIANMIAADTARNLRLTPKRMLLAHLQKITAGLQVINGNIRFMKGEGNTLFTAKKIDTGKQEDYNEAQLAENQNINWNDSNAQNIQPLWAPFIDEFEAPINSELAESIDANLYGYLEYYETPDNILAGYILEANENLNTGLTNFKILRKYGY